MSRSVMYLNNAETVIYFTVEGLNEVNEETKEIDYDLSQMNYDDFYTNLIVEIKHKLKSYHEPYKNKWDNRETKIILENNLCVIGLSEYCGCWSLSVAPQEEDYYLGYGREPLALNHAGAIRNTLEKCLINAGARVISKIGTFSNGEAVYRYK